MKERARKATSTSKFGTGRREAHDSSDFYGRFNSLEIREDDDLAPPEARAVRLVERGDSRERIDAHIEDNSVGLVVTSPPYFAGKEYEEALGQGHVPKSYGDHLKLLEAVFDVCKRKLEPGGRIAVNVANLGRKPYRSQAADVIEILQDKLGLLLRGEVVWCKGKGMSGSCAWGTFGSATNPVLRDTTERVIIASKGRFDRARNVEQRRANGFPYQSSLTNDEFLAATLDVWDMPPESARRVKHPAPFPVELPERLIHLYTYVGDLVLDPFMGSGSALVAAARTGRHYAGFDTDATYVLAARSRLAQLDRFQSQSLEETENIRRSSGGEELIQAQLKAVRDERPDDFQARASKEGKAAQAIGETVVEQAGFTIRQRSQRLRGLGIKINIVAEDAEGRPWYFDVSGAFTTTRGGLLRTDTMFKCLGRAHVMANNGIGPVVFLTSHLPKRRSEGDVALRSAGPNAFFDAVEMLSTAGRERLSQYAGGGYARPLPGFWTEEDVARLV